MKKIVIGIVLFIIISGSAFFFVRNSDGSEIAKSDKQVENELIISMKETKVEKEKIEKLLTNSSKELKDNGFGEVGLSYSNEERILTAQVNDKDFLDDNKAQIENIIINTAKEVGFNDFKIEFWIDDRNIAQNKEDNELMESLDKVSRAVSDVLKEKGYNNLSYSLSGISKNEIIIKGIDKDIVGDDELATHISNAILSETNTNYTVKLKKKSESEIRDMEWQPILTAIKEETNKKFDEYRGFAYSFNPLPLEIIIKTNINKSWFKSSGEKVKEIENYVERIIELKIEELSIKEIPYEIIIRDKNNKKIN
ncbi:hypothetical protein WAK64_05845 [Bacillus spongiae]|uniref:DUF4030 domain-containing protein n=1 Tax=Bacillus spongiae TaxID=2683610 RepID=A0ABU8HB90_9BACI